MAAIPAYNPRRRFTMVIIMWGVFFVGMGMAWGITYWRAHQLHAQLQPAATYGDLHVRLPAGWTTKHQKHGGNQVLTASEVGGLRRTITITTTKLDRLVDPFDLLAEYDLVPPNLLESRQQLVQQIQELSIENGEGMLLQLARRQSSSPFSPSPRETAAGVVFTDGWAAVVELMNRTPSRIPDTALVTQVAESLKIQPGAAPSTNSDDGDSI